MPVLERTHTAVQNIAQELDNVLLDKLSIAIHPVAQLVDRIVHHYNRQLRFAHAEEGQRLFHLGQLCRVYE